MSPRPATPARAVDAVLFDAYGTLFDLARIRALAEGVFPGQGQRMTALWREKQIEYTHLRSMSDGGGAHYAPFWQITRDALRFACDALALPLDEDGEARLMDLYRALPPHPENREVLEGLRAAGIPAGILSNGDPEMLDGAVGAAGFGDLLDPVLSVDEVRRFKPDPATYALGTARLGLPAGRILFVTANAWDAVGATWFGYTTLWVNRAGAPAERLDAQPAHVGSSLRDVLHVAAGG